MALFTTLFSFLTSTFGGGLVKQVSEDISKAYQAKLEAENDEKRLAAGIVVEELQAHLQLLLKEQNRVLTSWIRPAFAGIAFIYWAKIIVWDTVLGLGVTPMPNSHIEWFAVLIPSAYFILRPSEKAGENVLKNLFYRK